MTTATNGAGGTAPPATTTPPAEAQPAAARVELTSDQLKARLDESRAAARNDLLKELGLPTLAEGKKALEALKALQDEKLSADERTKKQLADLEPKAKRADALEASLKETLAALEGEVPEAKKGLLELAPADLAERATWLAKARAKGLFGADAAAVQEKKATSQAGTTPPAQGKTPPAAPPRHPLHMTPEERAQAKAAAEAEVLRAQG